MDQQGQYDFESYLQISRRQRKGEQLTAHCPFHDDKTPSFSCNSKTGLWICHAGCGEGNFREFMDKVDGNPKIDIRKSAQQDNFKTVAQYVYWDLEQNPVLKVNRRENGNGKKKFFQERFENGRWVSGGVKQLIPPYEYHKWRDTDKPLFLVEGEKCVKALQNIGLQATTTPGGAESWKSSFSPYFKDREIVILPDNDEAGEKYAEKAFCDLKPIAKSVKVVRLNHLDSKGDVHDYLANGGCKESLISECSQADFLSEWKMPNVVQTVEFEEDDTEYFENDWDFEMNELAYRGLAGEFVKRIEEDMEPDPIAVLATILACYGNLIGKGAHFRVQAAEHYSNLFVCLVGNTSKARKGTSFKFGSAIFKELYSDWFLKNVVSGLSSGEGLISPIRDPDEDFDPEEDNGQKKKSGYQDPPHPGVKDKRLLIKQEEFGATLKVMDRNGNNLSAMLREAWDSGDLSVMTKKPLRASGGHISIVGHITKNELLRSLRDTEAANGFGNRFIWLCVKRRRFIAWGDDLNILKHQDLIERFRQAVSFGQEVGRLDLAPETIELWKKVYEPLSSGTPELFGCMIGRSEAQVLRLSLIYALLDTSPVIQETHLRSALAFWQYAENSVRHIFGDYLGDPMTDEILRLLRQHKDGLTKTELHKFFGNNRKGGELTRCLLQLKTYRLAKNVKVKRNGKEVEVWRGRQNRTKRSKWMEVAGL